MIPRVAVVTAATVEPITVAELKEFLKLDSNGEDAVLAVLLTAAVNEAEKWTHRAFVNRTLRVWFDYAPPGGGNFELPYSPAVSITSIKSYDDDDTETTMDADDYKTDLVGEPPRISLPRGGTWPSSLRPMNAVAIEYVAGYGAAASNVPAGIKNALFMICAHYYEGKDSQKMAGNFQAIDAMPQVVKMALAPFTIPHFNP